MTPSTPRPAAPPLPRTEAGRRLLASLDPFVREHWAGTLAAIEAEAVAAERARLRDAVRNLDQLWLTDRTCLDYGDVLDLLLDPTP